MTVKHYAHPFAQNDLLLSQNGYTVPNKLENVCLDVCVDWDSKGDLYITHSFWFFRSTPFLRSLMSLRIPTMVA